MSNGKGDQRRGDKESRQRYEDGWTSVFGHKTKVRGRKPGRRKPRKSA